MILTGRIDCIYIGGRDGQVEHHMKETLKLFIECFSDDVKYIFMYENKTKSGTPCKEHLHFMMELTTTVKPDTERKKYRAILTKLGFSGALASMSVETEDNRDMAINYTCKQQQLFLTNYANSDELLLQSKIYNDSIKNKVQNEFKKWSDHKLNIINEIGEEMHRYKTTFLTRQQIITYIVTYTFKFNKEHPDHKFTLPTTDKLKPFINQIEQELFSEDLNIKLRIADASVFAFNTQLDKIYTSASALEPYQKREIHNKPKKTISELLQETDSDSD